VFYNQVTSTLTDGMGRFLQASSGLETMNISKDHTPSGSPQTKRKLTVKQSKFVDAYVATNGNGSEAARQAGYSLKADGEQAYDNLKKPQIQQAIADKSIPIYTPEYLQQRLTELIRRSDLAPGSLTKALELAMRNLAMLTDKQIQDVTQHTTADELVSKAEQAIGRLKHDTLAERHISVIMSTDSKTDSVTGETEQVSVQSERQAETGPTPSGNKGVEPAKDNT
jgi:hypothetical protein